MISEKSKKLGIVIPSFNQVRYLEKAITSAIACKKYIDADIVVMDGGSTDGSIDIIKKYESDLLLWRSEKDAGQGDAINKGMSHLLHCKYLIWLNSDDEYQSAKVLADMVEYAVKNQYDLCYGKSYFIDENSKIIGEYPTKLYSYEQLGFNCYFSQPSVMFSSEIWEKVGGINTNLHMCLDYELWIRMAKNSTVGYFEDYVGNTRMYGDTKTATNVKVHLEEAICILMHYYGKVPNHWIRSYCREVLAIKNRYVRAGIALMVKPFVVKKIVVTYSGVWYNQRGISCDNQD